MTANLMSHEHVARAMKFSSVAVVVRDEKKAMKFYHDKLGFRVVTKWAHWVTVSPPGSSVRIHLCPDSRPEKGNTGFSFGAKGVERLVKSLAKKGVKITQPVTKEEWGTYFMFADPDGNEFYVFED